MNPIRIIGGGLAGLSLGIALRRARVPVTLTEAGEYPRHRVCGEFISGAGQQSLESLGLTKLLNGAVTNLRTTWFHRNQPILSKSLPVPALGLSRFQLDARLAGYFQEMGGHLIPRNRARIKETSAGDVWACGRRGTSRDFIGLKLHCQGFKQETDLAMHLGNDGYVGISRIEDQKVNVCGLFRIRRHLSPGKNEMLLTYLRVNGLTRLAGQLEAATIDAESISATTALNFTDNQWPGESICIGDANASIPPFTGNGMSMAFESAEVSLPPLLDYAHGRRSWTETRLTLRKVLARRFRRRLATARSLHPILLHPFGQRCLTWAASAQILPFHSIYRLLR